MTVYYIQKTLNTLWKSIQNNKLNKVVGHKINIQKSTAFLSTKSEPSEREILIYNHTKKNKIS